MYDRLPACLRAGQALLARNSVGGKRSRWLEPYHTLVSAPIVLKKFK
jgi:hypothetical protein